MKVTQEKLPDSQVGLEIEVPADLSKQGYEQVLRDYMKSANIPGFRKGKVPRQVLIQRLGPTRLKAAALEDLVQKAIDQAIEQEELEAIGNYQLRSSFEDLIGQYEPGQPFIISASVDVPPRLSLSEYKDLSVKAEKIEPDPNRVDETLTRYRENLATLVPIEDRAAQAGDVAIIDFVGKLVKPDGEPEVFEGGSAEDFQVEIKEGQFIPGFVEGIIGMELEETKDVEVTFPEAYSDSNLAGQPAVFTITLNELKEKELPDLDDDFAQEVSDFETIAELRQSLEERYQEETEQATQANIEAALLDALVEHLEAEMPHTLVQREATFLVQQTVVQLSRQGIDVNKFLTQDLVEGMRKNARPEAIERLRRTLALGEVAKQEAIAVEEADILARMDEMLAEVEDPDAIDPDRLREVVNEDLLKEKILAWLKEQATIELVPEGALAPEEDEAAEPVEPDSEEAASAEPASAAEAVIDVEASA